MSLKLKQCSNKQEWDSFMTSSPQTNIFCGSDFLDALEIDYDLLLVEKNKHPQLGAIVLKCNGQPILAPYSYSMYQGILFAGFSRDIPPHRRVKWQLEITDFLLSEMEKHYPLISFCLHYRVEDLRSFQWFHYHEPKLGQFQLNLRYTGLIHLKKYSNFEDFYNTIRKVRRYEYHQAVTYKLKVKESTDIDKLNYLYRLTFERQGIKQNKLVKKNLTNLVSSILKNNFGKLLICENVKGNILSTTFYLYDNHCGYYLVGANHPSYRASGSGTFLMLENIKRCFEKKLELVDVCGINSPNRGDFKTSFNALPTPYFEVTWEKPSKRL